MCVVCQTRCRVFGAYSSGPDAVGFLSLHVLAPALFLRSSQFPLAVWPLRPVRCLGNTGLHLAASVVPRQSRFSVSSFSSTHHGRFVQHNLGVSRSVLVTHLTCIMRATFKSARPTFAVFQQFGLADGTCACRA